MKQASAVAVASMVDNPWFIVQNPGDGMRSNVQGSQFSTLAKTANHLDMSA